MAPEDAKKKSWVVFDYEVQMFNVTLALCDAKFALFFTQYVRNAFTESLLLHTRILANILLSNGPKPDDITLEKLLPGFSSPDIAVLKSHYGSSNEADTPCWMLNKRLAHASDVRTEGHDYSALVHTLTLPILTLVEQVNRARTNNSPSE
jgi:hypothetical protein